MSKKNKSSKFVLITKWRDIESQPDWTDIELLKKENCPEMVTIGFMLDTNKERVLTASTVQDDEKTCGDSIKIIKGAIVSTQKVKFSDIEKIPAYLKLTNEVKQLCNQVRSGGVEDIKERVEKLQQLTEEI